MPICCSVSLAEWLMQRAQIIFSIEQNMTDEERMSEEYKYWVDVRGKRWLQVEEEIDTAFTTFLDDKKMLELEAERHATEAAEAAQVAHVAEVAESQEKAETQARTAANVWKRKSNVPFGSDPKHDDPSAEADDDSVQLQHALAERPDERPRRSMGSLVLEHASTVQAGGAAMPPSQSTALFGKDESERLERVRTLVA